MRLSLYPRPDPSKGSFLLNNIEVSKYPTYLKEKEKKTQRSNTPTSTRHILLRGVPPFTLQAGLRWEFFPIFVVDEDNTHGSRRIIKSKGLRNKERELGLHWLVLKQLSLHLGSTTLSFLPSLPVCPETPDSVLCRETERVHETKRQNHRLGRKEEAQTVDSVSPLLTDTTD